MFVNEEGTNLEPLNFKTLEELECFPDPEVRLYILTSTIPKDCKSKYLYQSIVSPFK
jgi:hypothetical protein